MFAKSSLLLETGEFHNRADGVMAIWREPNLPVCESCSLAARFTRVTLFASDLLATTVCTCDDRSRTAFFWNMHKFLLRVHESDYLIQPQSLHFNGLRSYSRKLLPRSIPQFIRDAGSVRWSEPLYRSLSHYNHNYNKWLLKMIKSKI